MYTIQNKRDEAYYSSLFTNNVIHETETDIISSQPIPMNTSVYERFVDRLDNFVYHKLVDHYTEQNGRFIIVVKKSCQKEKPKNNIIISNSIMINNLTEKENNFYLSLKGNLLSQNNDNGELLVKYGSVENYTSSQIGAYITILQKKGVITSIQKDRKIVTIKNLTI